MGFSTTRAAACAALLAAACSSAPDFDAYCARAAPCEGEPATTCVSSARTLWQEQDARGCGKEGGALLACKTRSGRCEASMFAPGAACDHELDVFAACLDAHPPASRPHPVPAP